MSWKLLLKIIIVKNRLLYKLNLVVMNEINYKVEIRRGNGYF